MRGVARYDEPGWNVKVHHRILQAVFRVPQSVRAHDRFNFSICTTAKPDPTYLPRKALAKMVDFCVFAEMDDNDGLTSAALRQLSRHMPSLTVNHTDFEPLQFKPIVLSVETKKPGKELDTANLQLGIWHAAQWSFLTAAMRCALELRLQHTAGREGEALTAREKMDLILEATARVKQLPFLPGLVVQGHTWSLVLSTREGSKTTLWTEQQFGSTRGLQDAYKVVAGLRELVAWVRDVYLPWWRENILELISSSGVVN